MLWVHSKLLKNDRAARLVLEAAGGGVDPNGLAPAGDRRWRDLAVDPMPQPMAVAQHNNAGMTRI